MIQYRNTICQKIIGENPKKLLSQPDIAVDFNFFYIFIEFPCKTFTEFTSAREVPYLTIVYIDCTCFFCIIVKNFKAKK